LLQTVPAAQPSADPFGAVIPVSAQAEVPFAQLTVPSRHGAGEQAIPSAHATQIPPLQTLPAPQPLFVPSATLPLSLHCGAPIAQEVVAVLHGVVVVQELPSLQATHVPLLQNMSTPHELPLAAF
jgi:hypothetical protein